MDKTLCQKLIQEFKRSPKNIHQWNREKYNLARVFDTNPKELQKTLQYLIERDILKFDSKIVPHKKGNEIETSIIFNFYKWQNKEEVNTLNKDD